MRGVLRKVGMFHLARRRARDAIVLSDEGTLLSSYNLFVATKADFGEADVARFADLAPVPDLVVYVRAPVESLVERAMSRPDPRRQHVGVGAAEIEADVRRTVELFDLLVQTVPVAGRVTIVESSDLDEEGRARLGKRGRQSAGLLVAAGAAERRRRGHARFLPRGEGLVGALEGFRGLRAPRRRQHRLLPLEEQLGPGRDSRRRDRHRPPRQAGGRSGVSRRHRGARFSSGDRGWRSAVPIRGAPSRVDEAEGAIVHVHAYYRIISGESLTKNYRLPLKEMLLTNVSRAGAVIVPHKGAELVIFVLRMSVKHATLAELTSSRRTGRRSPGGVVARNR